MSTIDAVLVGETTFPFHDLDAMAPEIEAALGDAATVTATTDTAVLADPAGAGHEVVIDYLTDSHLPADRLEGLRSFVADGGGYLGLHPATDLTSVHDGAGGIDHREEPVAKLRELLGGQFLDHPEQSTFGVEIVADHPVTDGVADFSVYDEPYRVEHDAARVTVLARMDHPDPGMDDYPVAWTREVGDGRVCYASLGHTTDAFEHEQYRRLLRNAIEWVADE